MTGLLYLIAFLLVSAPLFGQNLLPNGDFTLGMEHWSLRRQDKNVPPVEIVPQGHDGKPALRLSGKSSVESNLIFLPSPIVSVSGWMKWSGVVPEPRRYNQAALIVQYFDKGGKILGHKVAIAKNGTGDWTNFNKEMVFPEAAVSVKIVPQGKQAHGGTIWFSELQVVPAKQESAAVEPSGENLVVNPGFELEAGGQSLNWHFPSGVDWDGMALNPDIGRNVHWRASGNAMGNLSLNLTGPATAVSETIDVKPGVYDAGAWMKTSGVVTGKERFCRAGVQIVYFDDHGRKIRHTQLAAMDGTTGWRAYQREVVVPEKASKAQIWVRLYDSASGEAWFDKISFTSKMSLPAEKIDRSTADIAIDFQKTEGKFPYHIDGINGHYPALYDRLPWKFVIDGLAVRRMGARYIRFQEGCSMTEVTRLPDGSMAYDFSREGELLHRITGLGLKPLIVLESTPNALSSRPSARRRNNRYPPRDYDEWEDYIYRFISYLRREFGDRELVGWRFETWNEPDATNYFKGTPDDLAKIQKHTVAAARRAFPEIQIGTPGFASPGNALDNLLAHFDRSHGQYPISFVSWHLYSTGTGMPSTLSLRHNLKLAADSIEAHSWAVALPRYITEWNSASGNNSYIGTAYNAAYALSALRRIKDSGIDLLFVFVDCESLAPGGNGSPENAFYKKKGLISTTGLIRPYARSFELLHRMRGEKVSAASSNRPVEALASANVQGKWVVLWNYVEDPRENFTTKVNLTIAGLPPSTTVAVQQRTLDQRNDPFPRWKALGSPDLNKEKELWKKLDQVTGLDSNLETVMLKTTASGVATLSIDLPVFSILSLLIPSQNPAAPQ
ncbi:MAG TPA: hypothetical protein VNQ90_12260 [Chthoniobacteraceae bacterium]|nr:hypothetical protein [Chthoniobacteraceae bacterium]